MPDALAILVSAGSLLVSVGLALYVRFSGPIAAREVLVDLAASVRSLENDLESVGLRWEKYREGVDSLLEELTQTEERVERGRRKTAAAASRLQKPGANGPTEPSDTYGELRARARSLGHPV